MARNCAIRAGVERRGVRRAATGSAIAVHGRAARRAIASPRKRKDRPAKRAGLPDLSSAVAYLMRWPLARTWPCSLTSMVEFNVSGSDPGTANMLIIIRAPIAS